MRSHSPSVDPEASPESASRILLVSDLDGTLIAPVPADPELAGAMDRFRTLISSRADIVLAYATGRDHALTLEGIRAFDLPVPDAILSDVGTRILHRVHTAAEYEEDDEYSSRLASALSPHARNRVEEAVSEIPGTELQEASKQGAFKVSFYVDSGIEDDVVLSSVRACLGEHQRHLKLVFSRDPVDSRGLLDVLPRDVSKASATRFLSERLGVPPDRVLYFGDSGNDTDALLAGFNAVVVGNASDSLRSFLRDRSREAGNSHRLYFARSPYVLGVMEGCHHFELL